MKKLLRVRLYVCANQHMFETGEVVIAEAIPVQRRKRFINTATVRGSESKWRQLQEYRA